MSWLQKFYETYENCSKLSPSYFQSQSDEKEREAVLLPPLFHGSLNTDIEVFVDEKGNFVSAVALETAEPVYVPMPEISNGRGNGECPHALCDNVPYLAETKEYTLCDMQDNYRISHRKKHAAYMKNLKDWHESEYTHPMVDAVYAYLENGTLLKDLVQAEIIFPAIAENGSPLRDNDSDERPILINNKKKVHGKSPAECNVRFRVLIPGTTESDATWKCESLQEAYKEYYISVKEAKDENGNYINRRDVCYFEGVESFVCANYPRGSMPGFAACNAKVVSTNDPNGLMYYGNWLNRKEDIFALGYIAAAKIFSAMSWVSKRFGVWVDPIEKTKLFTCWSPQGKSVPDIFRTDLMVKAEDGQDILDNSMYQKKLKNLFYGLRQQFNRTDDIVVFGQYLTSPGRISITYYEEFDAYDFLNHLQYWLASCKWYYLTNDIDPETGKVRKKYVIVQPNFREIVSYAFGVEKTKNGSFPYMDIDEKMIYKQMQRMLYVMLNDMPIPQDMIRALARQAASPLGKLSEKKLTIICAVYAKYITDKGGIVSMSLDRNNSNLSYLYGRLLALMDVAEYSTYTKEERGRRITNASKLRVAFIQRPYSTLLKLDTKMEPYFNKLPYIKKYKEEIESIVEMLSDYDTTKLNKPLKPDFFLGYYLERKELFTSMKPEEEDAEIVNEESDEVYMDESVHDKNLKTA